MNPARLDWLQRHSAEGGVSCAELDLRAAEETASGGRARIMPRHENAEALDILARWNEQEKRRHSLQLYSLQTGALAALFPRKI